MTSQEYEALLVKLDINQASLAKLLPASQITLARWKRGGVPESTARTLLTLLQSGKVKVKDLRRLRAQAITRGD